MLWDEAAHSSATEMQTHHVKDGDTSMATNTRCDAFIWERGDQQLMRPAQVGRLRASVQVLQRVARQK
jgi:hypothetical protein